MIWWVRVCVVGCRHSLSAILPVVLLFIRSPVRDAALLAFLFEMVGLLFNPHIRKEGCERAGALIDSR